MMESDQAEMTGQSPEPPIPFEQLYRRCYRFVFAFFLKRTSAEEAEELTQETFLNAYRGRSRFRNESHDTTWLAVIAKNVYANYVRDHNTQKRDGIEVPINTASTTEARPLLDPESTDPNALDEALNDERDAILRQAIASLPSRTHQIMRLAFVYGLKYREIAQTLEISVNTVKSAVIQGKQKLRDFIQEMAPELDVDLGDDDD